MPYIFPAGRGVVNRTTLTQYMADGGTLVDENGAAHIDTVALTDVLSFTAMRAPRVLSIRRLFQLTDPADSWTQYKPGRRGWPRHLDGLPGRPQRAAQYASPGRRR